MNRPSFNTSGMRFGHGFQMTPWALRLLLANFAMFMLAGLGIFPRELQVEWLGFAVTPEFFRKPWTPVTYMFVHSSFGHIFMNMLVLFFFGPPLEREWGSKFFLKYYLATGLGGALFSVLLYSIAGSAPMVGASGAIFGLLLAFALNWPDAKIMLYFVFPVPAKWFVGVLGAFTLLSTINAGQGSVAHWAHLGGLVTGFVFLKYGERIGWALEKAFFKEKPSHVKVERGGAKKTAAKPASPPPTTRRKRQVNGDSLDEVDRILDKIRASGMDSLTDKERAFLDEMSRQYKKKSNTH